MANTFTLFHFSLNYNGQGKKKKCSLEIASSNASVARLEAYTVFLPFSVDFFILFSWFGFSFSLGRIYNKH